MNDREQEVVAWGLLWVALIYLAVRIVPGLIGG